MDLVRLHNESIDSQTNKNSNSIQSTQQKRQKKAMSQKNASNKYARALVGCLLFSFGNVAASIDLCPDFVPTPNAPCTQVQSFSQFRSLLPMASELNLCPFDIAIAAGDDSAVADHGVSIRCVRQSEDDECIFRGPGTHLRVATSEDTLFQGLSFRESDDYAVHVVSDTDSANQATHTFCDCSLENNERSMSSRGGAFKTERGAGTVNIVRSSFENNFSSTYGAAIYSRANQLNVIESRFVENIASGWGGAIFCASDGNILIQKSVFASNMGRNGWAVVVNPKSDGLGVWTDGYDNASASDFCSGFYNLAKQECEVFVAAPVMAPVETSGPSLSSSPSVSLAPTTAPTTVAEKLCSPIGLDEVCVEVTTFSDFKEAIINNGSNRIVFCGDFRVRKPESERIVVSHDVQIVCQRLCTIYGRGTHLLVTGDLIQVELQKLKLMNSDQSAVQIATTSPRSTVTFCACQFWGNSSPDGKGGGAITIEEESGVVNVIDSSFSNNEASFGGAISSGGYMLNVIGSRFVMNQALKTGSAIASSTQSHLLIRTSLFGLNRLKSNLSTLNYAVTVHPDAIAPIEVGGIYIDAGKNLITSSGDCDGFYLLEDARCEEFSVALPQSILYPYVPGDLSEFDLETGIRVSTGLMIREIARREQLVSLTSSETEDTVSTLPFHIGPNGGGTFPMEDGGWVYISNSDRPNGKGGSYAVIFDKHGQVKDYQARLQGVSRNNNSGKSPFGTWLSCEVLPGGQCWQVDPLGIREPEVTILGGPEGGYLESVAYDDRDPSNLVFYVSEDKSNGVLRRVRPGPFFSDWDMLTKEAGTSYEYLVLNPNDKTFSWSSDIEEGRASAASEFPHSEGLSLRNGILYMTSKAKNSIYMLDLDSQSYSSFQPSQDPLVGDGFIEGEADQLLQISDDILYFAENGGTYPGVYGRDLASGTSFAVFEAFAEEYSGDDVTGIAFSPDGTRLYACFEELGVMVEVQRQDRLAFEDPPMS